MDTMALKLNSITLKYFKLVSLYLPALIGYFRMPLFYFVIFQAY